MSTPARLLAVGLVAVLSVAALAVTAAYLSDDEGQAGRSASASASPSSSAAVASPTPAASAPDDLARALAEIEAQVLELRGLPAPEIGPAEIIDRQQLAVELAELLDAEWTDEELERANLTLRAMGLLADDQDLRELTERLLGDQVLGFYDPDEQRMVVVSDEGLSPLARITYAHEYTHALQDGAFRSFDARDALTDDDAILARQALEEGDATVVMFQWALAGNLTPDELQDIGLTPQPDTSGVPGWMLRQLEFPYLAGFTFVNQLRTSAGGSWSAVNDAYTDAPVSTEQVLHPEKYLAGEQPIEIDPIRMTQALSGGWEDLEPTTMGEAMIDIWLVELGVDQATATGAAAGWGGDLLEVAAGPDGEWIMGWHMAWDTAADAAQFLAAYDEAAAPAGMATFASEGATGTETWVVHASSDELIPRVFAFPD
ncbi:MAG TPA: hypothetical protein VF071_01975 [Candidatus Limnocylindria bacterium]